MQGFSFPPQAVLFDLDGTLLDSRGDIARAANAARAHFHLAPWPEEKVARFVGRGVSYLVAGVLETQDPFRLEEGTRVLLEHYRRETAAFSRFFDGAKELLDFLDAERIPCAIISNKPSDLTRKVLTTLNVERYFSVVFGHDDTPKAKPHPQPLLSALEKLNVSPEHAFFIGDSPVDIQAARAAGIRVGVVTHGFSSLEELKAAKPDVIVHHLLDFIKIFQGHSFFPESGRGTT